MYRYLESKIERIKLKVKRSVKRISLTTSIQYIVIFILIFILSGGVSLIVNPNLNAIITLQTTGGESPLEFTIFMIINIVAFLGIYIMYKAVKGINPDTGLAVIGTILLILSILISIYILSLKVPQIWSR